LQLARLGRHRVEHAAVVTHARRALGRAAALSEHAFEHHPGIDVHRQRRRGRAPRHGVQVGAIETGGAGADVTGEVFGCDFKRWERRLLSDLLRHDLIDRRVGEHVFRLGSLRPHAGQESGRAHGVIADLAAWMRACQVGDEEELVLERVDRLQDWLDVESRPDDFRDPLLHDRAVGDVDGAKPGARTCLRARERRERREHRVEQRQCDGGADTSQERPPG
jgi:hypothetical protein